MGIQAYIKMENLEKVASKVFMESESNSWYDEDDNLVKHVTYHTKAVFSEGEELWFNTYPDKSGVWIDVNHWGSNRAKYLPVLDKYKVEYVES